MFKSKTLSKQNIFHWCEVEKYPEMFSKLTNKKYLWLRNNLSTMTSSLIDSFIFSILAWIIFNPEPLDFFTVFITFILGTYILRIFISLIDTPFVYLAKYFNKNKYNDDI